MKYIVSAIEDGIIRLEAENKEAVYLSTEKISFFVKEGDVLFFDGEKYVPDSDATKQRKADVFAKFSRILEKNKNI